MESAAVVLSILLAFLIDASWDAHKQAQCERMLLHGLLADFEASRPGLENRLDLARRLGSGTGRFLDLVGERPLPATVTVPDTLVISVLGGPTFEPATNTLDAALASGEIEVRRITNEQVVPLLSRVADVRPYFAMVLQRSGGDPYAAGRLSSSSRSGLTGEAPLRVSTELVGALSLRKFFVDFSAADLEELDGILSRLVTLLREELDR